MRQQRAANGDHGSRIAPGSETPALRLLRREKAAVEQIASGSPLASVLTDLAMMIEELGENICCSFCVLDEGKNLLVPTATPSVPPGFRDALSAGVPIGPTAGSCGTAAFRRAEVVSSNIATDPLWEEWRELALSNGIQACWSTPIFSSDGQLQGTFAIYYPQPRSPLDEERAWVASATHIAAIAIAKHRSEQTIEWMAHHDQLTGLVNRVQFEKVVTRAIADAANRDGMIGVAFLDLDHFKRINDTVGHRLGDELLLQVSQRLKEKCGEQAVAARFGGDEFVLLFSNVDSAASAERTAEEVLDSIRQAVQLGEFTFAITASVGLSLFPNDGASADALIESADRAMYQAKAAGRNAVRVFDPALSVLPQVSSTGNLAEATLPSGSSNSNQSNRLAAPVDAQNAQEFVQAVGSRLGADLACLRIVTAASNKLVMLGLFTKTEAFKNALDAAIDEGLIGGVLPQRFGEALPVKSSRVGTLLDRDPAVLSPHAWIENVAIREQRNLVGVFTLVGEPDSCESLTREERKDLETMCRLQILAHNEARRRGQLERQLRFITTVSTSLSSTTPVIERLKATVVAAQEALDFDSIQLITWNPTHETVLLNALYVKDVGFLPDRTWDSMTKEEVVESIERFRVAPGPYVIPNPADLPDIRPEQRSWMRHNGIGFLIFVPLMHESEQYGTLVITSRFSRGETEERLTILTSIGGHLAALLQLSLLLAEVQQSYEKLRGSHLNTVETLAIAAEMRDKTTGQHLQNLRDLSRRIGSKLGLSNVEIEDLGFAAVVHDIGKLNVPDRILLKPARLSLEEWTSVKGHTEAGEQIIARTELPSVSREVVRWHHERWDGSGYPDGLRGESIPLAVQIVTLADVFDALISKRPYKDAWPVSAALEEILRGRGTHFSPDVTDAFLALDLSVLTKGQAKAA